ncbi:hypothetical protein JTB14_035506 [Gonioctena quinquepunctata]|nr:hypothetical protein JTB14_035506 [Gonioctena quinquepunctata]
MKRRRFQMSEMCHLLKMIVFSPILLEVTKMHAHRYENILPSPVVSENEPLRKSSRIRKPVNMDNFVEYSTETIFEHDDPIDIEDALSRSDVKL